jgi:hypothetical protein
VELDLLLIEVEEQQVILVAVERFAAALKAENQVHEDAPQTARAVLHVIECQHAQVALNHKGVAKIVDVFGLHMPVDLLEVLRREWNTIKSLLGGIAHLIRTRNAGHRISNPIAVQSPCDGEAFCQGFTGFAMIAACGFIESFYGEVLLQVPNLDQHVWQQIGEAIGPPHREANAGEVPWNGGESLIRVCQVRLHVLHRRFGNRSAPVWHRIADDRHVFGGGTARETEHFAQQNSRIAFWRRIGQRAANFFSSHRDTLGLQLSKLFVNGATRP